MRKKACFQRYLPSGLGQGRTGAAGGAQVAAVPKARLGEGHSMMPEGQGAPASPLEVFLAELGLCCFAQAFSSCGAQAWHCSGLWSTALGRAGFGSR